MQSQICKRYLSSQKKLDQDKTDWESFDFRGNYGEHYTFDQCFVCDTDWRPSKVHNVHNLLLHLNSSKHLKNMINHYSANFDNQCIYCNRSINSTQEKRIHLHNVNHVHQIKLISNNANQPCYLKTIDNYNLGTTDTQQNDAMNKMNTGNTLNVNSYDDGIPDKLTKPGRAKLLTKKRKLIAQLGLLRCSEFIVDGSNDMEQLSEWEHQLDFGLKQLQDICQIQTETNDNCVCNSCDTGYLILCIDAIFRLYDKFPAISDNTDSDIVNSTSSITDKKTDIVMRSVEKICNLFLNVEGSHYGWKLSFNVHETILQTIFSSLSDVRYKLGPSKDNFDDNDEEIIDNIDIDSEFGAINGKSISNTLATEREYLKPIDCYFDFLHKNGVSIWSKGLFDTQMDIDVNSGAANDSCNIDHNCQAYDYYIKQCYNSFQDMAISIRDFRRDISCSEKTVMEKAFSAQLNALQKCVSSKYSKSVAPALRALLYGNYDQCAQIALNANNGNNNHVWNLDESCLSTSKLNQSQKRAVYGALNNFITLIEGPPGTGKTQVAASIAEQYVSKYPNSRILVSGFTNQAVDVLCQRIDDLTNVKPIRIAWASTLSDDLVLDQQLGYHNWKRILDTRRVICCTSISSVTNNIVKRFDFDLVLIDETTQSTEINILCALSRLNANSDSKIVLIGDDKQLPPTVISQISKKIGFNVSLFERIMNQYARTNEESTDIDSNCKTVLALKSHFLDTQYRMHPAISKFVNNTFYGSRLQDGISKPDRLLFSKGNGNGNGKGKHFFPWPNKSYPICFVECNDISEMNDQFLSIMNQHEAQLVCNIAQRLIQDMINYGNYDNKNMKKHRSITIITPYRAQKKLIESLLKKQIVATYQMPEVKTIDGFQGSECDIVIFSCVRANESKVIGFLNDRRRINVMLSRPRLGLIVIGNSQTFGAHPLWKQWLDHVCRENKSVINSNLFIKSPTTRHQK